MCQGLDCWITMHGFTTKSHHQVSGKVGLPRYQQSLVLASVFPLPPSLPLCIHFSSESSKPYMPFPGTVVTSKEYWTDVNECLRHWETAQRTHTN